MKRKIILVFAIINILFLDKYLYAQRSVGGIDTLNFIVNKTYTLPIEFSGCKLFTVKDTTRSFYMVFFQNDVNITYSHFDNAAAFANSRFGFATIFANLNFNKSAHFTGSKYQGMVDFNDSKFHGSADFSHAEYQDTVNAQRCGFDSTADFSSSKFHKITRFGSLTVKDTVYFSYSYFYKNTDFSFSKFFNIADYSHSEFLNKVDFSKLQFQSTAYFSNATFQNLTDFKFAQFRNVADFSSLTTSDSTFLNFYKALLPHLINFSGNTGLHHFVDFGAADFSRTKLYNDSTREWHYINLSGSDIDEVKIDYQHFRLCFFSSNTIVKDNLGILFFGNNFYVFNKIKYSLKDCGPLLKTDKVEAYLKQIFPSAKPTDSIAQVFLLNCLQYKQFPAALSNDEIYSTYEKVLKNFDVSGQKISYETLDIEYRDFKNGWFIIPHLWYCYGYHKEWIFGWSLLFITLFTIITYFLLDKLNGANGREAVYPIEKIPEVVKGNTVTSFFRKVWYALMYTSTIFFLLNLKIDSLNFKKGLVAYVLLVYAVGLLCLGYMANFILQK